MGKISSFWDFFKFSLTKKIFFPENGHKTQKKFMRMLYGKQHSNKVNLVIYRIT